MATKQFKAESKRLMELMINSIYTNNEIFLREILSNASDALDKLCYKALTENEIGMSRSDFEINIAVDKDARTITITDNGIGMTKEELESNLGTIARSGSLKFKEDMSEEDKKEDIDIIGQFGVGFYSAFMVSDEVTVTSRAYGEDAAWKWQSSGADGYSIAEAKKDTTGTEIVMHIKPDAEEEKYSNFLEEYTITSLVKKYSDYIRYPIKMEREKFRPKEGGEEGETESYREIETLNSMIPIWQRQKSEVTDDDYNAFYKEKFFDFEDPLLTIHQSAEGLVSYKALMFVPSKASYDFYTKEYKRGLQLYSSGVLIMDKCEDLLPEHFRFVRGVVDSPDLSLNISREMLQQNHQLKTIASNIERKLRNELLKLMSDNREKYENFYNAFGLQIKYGVLSDYGMHKEQLQDLLLFPSSDSDKLTSLAEYLTRMKDGQETIYYATGDNAQKISALPETERIREKGYEILYFTHEVDEFVAQTLMTYNEKPIKSIRGDDLGLETEDEKKKLEEKQEENKSLLDFAKETLGEEVEKVRLTDKLRSYPVCLTAEGPLSFEMERYLNTVQPDGDAKAQRVLEFNPEHPVFQKLQALQQDDPEAAKRTVKILYHQAELMAGLTIEDPTEYSSMIFDLL